MRKRTINLFEFPVKRGRKAVEPIQKVVTLLTPLHVEPGLFPTITRKVLKLQDASLRASRWPVELRFEGAPFGTADMVYRRAGAWQAALPPYPDPITARVERIVLASNNSPKV